MSIEYEVMAVTGKYTDRNGEEKNRWMKCGVVMTTKSGGLAMKLEAMPIGGEGWFSLMTPKPKDEVADKRQQSQAATKAQRPLADATDDIPF